MSTTYDADNIFAKILSGAIPSHKVYEDDIALAFMDVMPQGPGHTLVIPKAPSRNMLDADAETLAQLMPRVQKVAMAVKAAYNADGVTVFQFNETAAGQTVFHLHFHVVPRFNDVALTGHTGKMEEQDVLKAAAEKIKAALG